MTDSVNQPAHYNYGKIECIDAIRAMLGEEGFKSYCRGNAAKYTWRAGLKINEVEDLQKAAWYNRMAAGDDPRAELTELPKLCEHGVPQPVNSLWPCFCSALGIVPSECDTRE